MRFKNKHLIFLDFPIGPIGLSPLWILWLQKSSTRNTILLLLLIGIPILYFYDSTTILDNLKDFAVLAQLPLAIAFGKYLKISNRNVIRFYFIIILFILSIDFLIPSWRELVGLESKGLENFRFSLFSGEPSYFAHFILFISCLYWVTTKKIPWGFILFCIIITRSKTFFESFLFLFSFYLIYGLTHKQKIIIKASELKKKIILLICAIFFLINSSLFKLYSIFTLVQLGSWRMYGNYAGFQVAGLWPSLDYKNLIYNYSMVSSDVNWMKEAVWGFFPFIGARLGYIFGSIFLFFCVNYLVGAKRYMKFTKIEYTLIFYSIFHSFVLSPRYNISFLILTSFIIYNSKAYGK
jgi:hypothetical protein